MIFDPYPPGEWLTLLISTITFSIGYRAFLQEKLRIILNYAVILYLGDFCWLVLIIPQPNEYSLQIKGLFLLSTVIVIGMFIPMFWALLSLKRNGRTYKVDTIYDLAQLGLTAPHYAKLLSISIWVVSYLPPSPGFLMRWIWAQSLFEAHPYVGVLSFWSSAFISYPYARMLSQMWYNKNVMLNPKGPRWFFDKRMNLTLLQISLLHLSAFFGVILTLQPSLVWYLANE